MPADGIWWNRGGPFAFFCCYEAVLRCGSFKPRDCRLDMARHGVKLQRENGLRGYWNWASNELLCRC